MRRLMFAACALLPSLALADPLVPSAAPTFITDTATSAAETPTADTAVDHSLLARNGQWWLAIQGGLAYSLPYSSAAVADAAKSPGTTYDLSSDQSSFGGVSIGRAFPDHHSLEVGGVLLAPRHYHVRVEDVSAISSDIRRDLQTGFVFAENNHHWFIGWDNTLSFGLQGGLALLFETRHSEVPSQGVDSTELSSDIGLELSPLLRVDHYFDASNSFGAELGYRVLRFSKGSGEASDPLNFSGLTASLRWTTSLGTGPLAVPAGDYTPKP